MNLLKKFISIFFIFTLFTSSSNSMEKAAFINIDYIIKNSIIGKKTLSKINELNQKNIIELKKKEKILKDLEEEIKNKKKIVSIEAYNKEVALFKKKIQNFNNEENISVNEFNKFKDDEFEKIFNQISPIISDYMKQNSISILFDSKNIIMGNVSSDLTEKILNEINNNIK